MAWKLILRTDYPNARCQISLPEAELTTLNDLVLMGASSLRVGLGSLSRYMIFNVPYQKDAIELTRCDMNATLGEVGVLNRSTVVFQAPADIKPDPVEVTEEGQTKERFEGLNSANAFEELQNARGLRQRDVQDYIDIYAEDCFAGPGFINVPVSLVQALVTRDRLNVVESTLWMALLRWARHTARQQQQDASDPAVLRALLEPCLEHVRFPVMSKRELTELVVPENILDAKELVVLLQVAQGFGSLPSSIPYPRLERQGTELPDIFSFLPVVDNQLSGAHPMYFGRSSGLTLGIASSPVKGKMAWGFTVVGSCINNGNNLIVGFTYKTKTQLEGVSERLPGKGNLNGLGWNLMTGQIRVDGKMISTPSPMRCRQNDTCILVLDMKSQTVRLYMRDIFVDSVDVKNFPILPVLSATDKGRVSLFFPSQKMVAKLTAEDGE